MGREGVLHAMMMASFFRKKRNGRGETTLLKHEGIALNRSLDQNRDAVVCRTQRGKRTYSCTYLGKFTCTDGHRESYPEIGCDAPSPSSEKVYRRDTEK